MKVTERLEAALADVERGELEAALERCLEAWRTVADPDLAEIIERLGERIAEGQPTLRMRTIKATVPRWEKVAQARRAADLNRLLETITVGSPRVVRDHARQLAEWPRDPRLLTRLLDVVRSRPSYQAIPEASANLPRLL